MTSNTDQLQALNSNFSNLEYLEVEKNLYSSSEHVNLICSYIEKYILPEIELLKSYLDIGAGPGYISKRLQEHFQETTLVDPNEDYKSLYDQLKLEYGVQARIGNFQDIDFWSKYSFILCSHVLYHVPSQLWPSIIKKIRDLLFKDGIALITMVSSSGEFHDLCNSINPNYSNSKGVINILKKEKLLFRVSKVNCNYKFKKFSDLLNLLKLFVIDDCFLPEEYESLSIVKKQEIDKKIEDFASNCKKESGEYQFHTTEDYITLFNS